MSENDEDALYHAVLRGQVEAVKFSLEEMHLDPAVKNKRGQDIFCLAENISNPAKKTAIKEMLYSYANKAKIKPRRP